MLPAHGALAAEPSSPYGTSNWHMAQEYWSLVPKARDKAITFQLPPEAHLGARLGGAVSWVHCLQEGGWLLPLLATFAVGDLANSGARSALNRSSASVGPQSSPCHHAFEGSRSSHLPLTTGRTSWRRTLNSQSTGDKDCTPGKHL